MIETKKENIKDLSAKAIRGVIWVYLSYVSSKLLVFISTMILARLLAPSEFGLVAFALLIVSYLDNVGDFGITSALIYEQKESKKAANASFFICLSTGVLWFLLSQAIAPYVAVYFKAPEIENIFRAISFVFLINAFANTNDAILRKELSFKKRLVPEFSRGLLKGLFSIGFALLGYGVWSLVWGHLIGAIAWTISLLFVVRWKPRIDFDISIIINMLKYGYKIVAVRILAGINHHIDYFIVGGLLGSSALGYYSLASKIPELAIILLIWGVGKVAFPTYSKLQNDKESLKKSYLISIRYLSFITFPAGIGIALLASQIIYIMYGEKWGLSIPVLQSLALAASLRSLSSNSGEIYKATGRPDILVKLGVIRAFILIPILVYSVNFGIAGVAFMQLIITALNSFLSLYISSRVLDIPFFEVLDELKVSVFSSVLMAVCLYLLIPLISLLPTAVLLFSTVIVGILVYSISAWFINPNYIQQAYLTLSSSFKKVS